MEIKRLLKKSIANHTVLTDIFVFCLIKFGFANKYTAGLITMYKAYDQLRKKYEKYIGINDLPTPKQVKDKHVWICWWQGIDNAPDVIKLCFNSIQYWLADWNIHVITLDNYRQYVTFPSYIEEKWKKGVISNTLMSDLLRIDLLINHGGLWLDATTLLTGPLPDYIYRNSFFAFRNGWMDNEMINMGSWFLYASRTQNKLLLETQHLLYEYWKYNDYTKNYFLFHIFFRMVTDRYPEMWNQVPYINHMDQHLLIRECQNEKLSDDRIKDILKTTTIHKLTYKAECVESLIKKVLKINNIYD